MHIEQLFDVFQRECQLARDNVKRWAVFYSVAGNVLTISSHPTLEAGLTVLLCRVAFLRLRRTAFSVCSRVSRQATRWSGTHRTGVCSHISRVHTRPAGACRPLGQVSKSRRPSRLSGGKLEIRWPDRS